MKRKPAIRQSNGSESSTLRTCNAKAGAARASQPLSADLVAELPKDLLSRYRKLHALCDRESRLMSFFRVGQIVRNCRTETEALGKRFRLTSQLDFLADALQVDAHFLRDTQKLVDTYSEQEYVALIQQPSITWGHLLNLLAVPVAVEREKLVARVIAEKWSSNKLAREIHKQWPRPPQSPTRRVKPPQNLKAGLERAIRMAKSLSNTFDDALFGDQFDLTTRVLETAPDDVTPAMEQQVREAIETLARLSKTADENSRRLREALVWIEMVLKVRNSIPGGAGQLDVERDEGDAPRHR